MSSSPILIVPGEKKSIFFEIFFKSINSKKFISPLILVCSKKILNKEIKNFSFNKKIELINLDQIIKKRLKKRRLYIIDINSHNSKTYIQDCFSLAFKIIKQGLSNKLINGPINKTKTLRKKHLGMTEYVAKSFNQKKFAMLIYNDNLSVCPITTHLPLKLVSKKITKKLVIEKIIIINEFYKKVLGLKPKIGVVGLNPHCESILKFNEDTKVILPAIKLLKKKNIKASGPYPADTIFMKNNIKNFDVIVGMYHDQVLAPIKTLFEYDAINITIGLPFFRITPDHGPNEMMVGKGKSNPMSLIKAISFLDKI
ncbi:4-hydroxythreonine-4-phosphate dehydrogenase PdxA [Candidatus Pelagibacter sp.]|uniref:4-hydroxythreonine-4-phosphate dehydrogenase PdxA n=1 Tax=Candidatus Pelagibacter sp. TaxID=2024849 RepID=UPI003F875B8F